MRTFASIASALALVAAFAAPASAGIDAFTGNIQKGVPQLNRPGVNTPGGINPDGRGRLTWGSTQYIPLSLGLDFQVAFGEGITVWQLGVWDDNVFEDGVFTQELSSTLILDLWDTETGDHLGGVTALPGTGQLRGDYRYFDLPTSVFLEDGDKFTVSVYYGPGNLDSSGNSGRTDQNLEPRPDYHGLPYVQNVGDGRYGVGGPLFPALTDTGPANRYHAVSFNFSPNPEPGTMILIGGVLTAAGIVRRRRKRRQQAA